MRQAKLEASDENFTCTCLWKVRLKWLARVRQRLAHCPPPQVRLYLLYLLSVPSFSAQTVCTLQVCSPSQQARTAACLLPYLPELQSRCAASHHPGMAALLARLQVERVC